ncbi:hypothetical protein B9Z55_018041 [Caenorhabditis nigoni]|uniref:7TM GPCR serpentine receptor class x (Srx) domain-containing protein n=1 Tax=Caenorhabditis nigoni TaxID=1611254 RepID=A0A2G5TC12_9PELO|nr:hypothetical protein B9Z55_018041 [Caenorhabditis nigoni]
MCEKSFSEFIYIPFLTFTITLIGILANSWVLAMSKKSSSMVGSFGTITRNQAVCNVLMCLIFIATVLPMQLGFFKSLIPHSHYLGTAAMTVHEVSNSAHFLMSFNRFCAFYMPHHYEKLFSKSSTRYYTTFLWIFFPFFCILLYEIPDCHISYSSTLWTLEFQTNEVCKTLTWYFDFLFNSILIFQTLFLNLITAQKARKKSQELINSIGLELSKSHRKREWNFIKQMSAQGLAMFMGQFSYYIGAPLIGKNHFVLLFFCYTLWAFMHAFEGLIMMASNKDLWSRTKTNSVVIFVQAQRHITKIGYR